MGPTVMSGSQRQKRKKDFSVVQLVLQKQLRLFLKVGIGQNEKIIAIL
jgi:hypothetical protein